jgi:hypothetical protein
MATKFFDEQRVVLTRDLGDDLKAGMQGQACIVLPLWEEFPFANRFAVIMFDEIMGWHATRMLGTARVLIEHFCVPVMDEMLADDELIYTQDKNEEYWFVNVPKSDLANEDDTQEIVIEDDAESDEEFEQVGATAFDDWQAHPYEMVSDEVIDAMLAKYPNYSYHYPRIFGGLYIAITNHMSVKRGMVGKYYFSPSSPTSSDRIFFTLPNGEKFSDRWLWEFVVPYTPNIQIIEGDTIPKAYEDIWECPVCTHQNDDELQACEMCGFDFGDDDTEGDDVNLGMADLIDA